MQAARMETMRKLHGNDAVIFKSKKNFQPFDLKN